LYRVTIALVFLSNRVVFVSSAPNIAWDYQCCFDRWWVEIGYLGSFFSVAYWRLSAAVSGERRREQEQGKGLRNVEAGAPLVSKCSAFFFFS